MTRLLSLLLLSSCAPASAPLDLVEAADLFVGTGGQGFGVGSASPAATAPFGQITVGPDTGEDYGAPSFSHCAGYYYEDSLVRAFSHTRLHGVGISEGGAIGIMPTSAATITEADYRRPLDHAQEIATPGYYALSLDGIADVELTASGRTAVHRYTWDPALSERWITVNLDHTASTDFGALDRWIEIDADAGEIRGYVLIGGQFSDRFGGHPFWFVAQLDAPPEEVVRWADGVALEEGSHDVAHGLSLRFEEDLEIRLGISSVDLDGARLNLETEALGQSFEAVQAATEAQWAEEMGVFEVEGGDDEARAVFASALYHVLQLPTDFTDVDGRYRGVDQEIHAAHGWTYYTDFSLWDTYRTLHPLVILAWPELAADHARSLTDMGDRLGFLPRWPQGVGESGAMIGSPAEIVLAESWLKGITDFPAEDAFQMARRGATWAGNSHIRGELSLYLDYGYVPHDLSGEGAAKTQEYAIADHAVGLWATDIGLESLGADLLYRSRSFRHVFDPETGFARGRNSDGSWAELEDSAWGDAFSEGTAWQYTWLAPHDAETLAELFGGREALFTKLDEMFELSRVADDTFLYDIYYWHGNEPDLHASLLYADLGDPASTQEEVRWVQDSKYAADPAGLDGNDDAGTLSAWYVFTAMGLYPVNGTDRYLLTTPRMDRVVIHRDQGDLVIQAEGEGIYLAGARLDGVELELAELRHEQLAGTRHLELIRSETPTGWGAW